MTLTTHAAIGAAIGAFIDAPLAGFILGATSHFLVDMIPHGDNHLADLFRVHKKKKLAVTYVTVDACVAIMFVLAIFSANLAPNHIVAAAIAGSILPDLLVGLSEVWKTKWLKKFFNMHFYFHDFFSRKHGDVKLQYALIGQACFIIVLMKYIS